MQARQVRRLVTGASALLAFTLAGCGLNVDDPYLEAPVVSLAEAPPPLSGGTLLVTRDERYAVLSDPDRHRLVVVDLDARSSREIPIARGLEPGRLVEDGSGRVYVALRRGGGVVEIDPTRAEETGRHATCANVRGLAWQSELDRLHVACADGTLVTLDRTRQEERRLTLPPDLRDVVATDAGLLVTRHRSAEVLRVDDDGEVHGAQRLPIAELRGVGAGETPSGDEVELSQRYAPGVAVRLARHGAGAVVLHQRARIGVEAVFEGTERVSSSYTYSSEPVSSSERGYTITWRDPCGNAVVHAAATFVSSTGRPLHVAPSIARGVVPIDVAVSEGGRLGVAFAGEPGGAYRFGPQVLEIAAVEAGRDEPSGCLTPDENRRYPGQVVAVAFRGEELVAQLREPAGLVVGGVVIEIPGASVRDTGHDIFHLDTGGTIACASCHPEGGDDGHVWHFAAVSPRRTQSLEGMVGLAPYHRAGNVPTFARLMDDLSAQMASPPLEEDALQATERWLARLPAPPTGPVLDPSAVERGRELFHRADVGCADCHEGELGTDNRSHEALGGSWQTPALRGVALRAPYLHDGRAPTLRAAFVSPSGETTHGPLRSLSETDVVDLEAYLAAR